MREVCYKRWETKFAGYWKSNLTLAEYCRRNNLNIKTASKWRKRLRPDFVQTIIKQEEPSTSLEIVPVLPDSADTTTGVTVEFNSFRIVVQKDFDAPTMQRLLRLLEVI